MDKAILSCKGIDPKAGITDSADPHALAKQAMLGAASEAILALDDSKFDKVSFVQVAPLEAVGHVVSNCRPTDKWLELFHQLGIACHYPEEE